MILVEQHNIGINDKRYKQIDRACFLSKNLYNAALFTIKQEFLSSAKWIRSVDLNKKFVSEDNVDFRALSGSSAQQVLMNLDKNLKSYFSAIKAWKRDNKKFTGCPKFPNYKHKTQGRNIFTYSYAQFKHRNGMIYFPKKEGFKPLPTNCPEGSVKSIRFIPKQACYMIELCYEVPDVMPKQNNGNAMGIDIGVNNLAACVTNTDNPFIINGRPLKSMNQYYNKKIANLKSQLKRNHGKEKSKRIARLTHKRNNKIKNYLHKASKYIVDKAVKEDITTIVVGQNKGWKQDINIGKRNNQNFIQIPFHTFIAQLKYKSMRQGLTLIETEESYTSKCSAQDMEQIGKHKSYIGTRKHRGLFISPKGTINADINAAWNILRKVTGDAAMPTSRGLGHNPVKVHFN